MKKFKKLSRNNRNEKRAALSGYLHGHCCILAIAFHREFSEQIVFLMNEQKFIHACTRTSDGKFRDARGIVSPEDVSWDIFDLPKDYGVKEMTEGEVFAYTHERGCGFSDLEVIAAARRAQTVWPHWPWRDSFLTRSLAFLADLERISKLHRVYVHGTVPTLQPFLSPLESDHQLKYCLTEVIIGQHFLMEAK